MDLIGMRASGCVASLIALPAFAAAALLNRKGRPAAARWSLAGGFLLLLAPFLAMVPLGTPAVVLAGNLVCCTATAEPGARLWTDAARTYGALILATTALSIALSAFSLLVLPTVPRSTALHTAGFVTSLAVSGLVLVLAAYGPIAAFIAGIRLERPPT